ncbi:MAG: hypothetical protein JNK38_10940 [Acidobacteria bacterium]|nr:hypothetical protein [Acidobacteriota bacterium]
MTIQTIRRFFILRPIWLGLLVLLLYSVTSLSVRAFFPPTTVLQTPTPVPTATAEASQADTIVQQEAKKKKENEQDIPWGDYHEALKTERELLAAQVDRQERWLLGVGAFLAGLIVFLFGQTRRDVVAQLREDVRERIREDVERELAAARTRVREDVEREVKSQFAAEIRKTVGDYVESHHKTQPIRWVAQEDSDIALEVMEALQTLKFTNVRRVAPDRLTELAGARVVIFSYGKIVKTGLTEEEQIGNKSALEQLRQLAVWISNQPVPIPLVIYNESNRALDDKVEKPVLREVVYVPANFASTIITQTLTLLHR